MSDFPFRVVNDEAYERMMLALRNGTPIVKSYVGVCPHAKKEGCKCISYDNYLNSDGDMERNIDGVIKQVISYTYFKYLMSNVAKGE
jgi:hypothetical protein